MATSSDIGARIRRAREEARLTQQQLGRVWGNVTHAAISDIERGVTRVSASRLAELAKLLNKPVSYFYNEEIRVSYLRGGRASDGSISDNKVAEEFLRRLKAERASRTHND